MAHDYHIAEYLRPRILLLPKAEMEELFQILEELLDDPWALFGRVPRGFPFRPGSFVAERGSYRICYEFANDGTVMNIFSITPLPEIPDLWEGFEPIDIDNN